MSGQLYQERVARFITSMNHQEPDRVPVLGFYETWAIGYSNVKYEEMINDFDLEMQVYGKVFEDFPFDGTISVSNHRASKLYRTLGKDSYFVSEDGSTLQHKEVVMLQPEEYPQFIEDPRKFTLDVLLKKKFPDLSKGDEASYQALKGAVIEGRKFGDNMMKAIEIMKEKYAMPYIFGDYSYAPVDLLFDFYRGFKGISMDMRRNPDEIIEAGDKLADIMIALTSTKVHLNQGYPFLFVPMHLPAFMSKKQFEKLYWPSFKKYFMNAVNQGVKILFYFETNMEHIYDFLLEFPKGTVGIFLEGADIFKAKDFFAGHVTIAGGLKTESLRYKTKQECIEETKRVIDHCAPGGGFILTTDKILITPTDVNPDNFKAVLDFAASYVK